MSMRSIFLANVKGAKAIRPIMVAPNLLITEPIFGFVILLYANKNATLLLTLLLCKESRDIWMSS